MTEIDYNSLICEVVYSYDGTSITKDAIWKALTQGGYNLPKKPVKATFTVKLNKLVE